MQYYRECLEPVKPKHYGMVSFTWLACAAVCAYLLWRPRSLPEHAVVHVDACGPHREALTISVGPSRNPVAKVVTHVVTHCDGRSTTMQFNAYPERAVVYVDACGPHGEELEVPVKTSDDAVADVVTYVVTYCDGRSVATEVTWATSSFNTVLLDDAPPRDIPASVPVSSTPCYTDLHMDES